AGSAARTDTLRHVPSLSFPRIGSVRSAAPSLWNFTPTTPSFWFPQPCELSTIGSGRFFSSRSRSDLASASASAGSGPAGAAARATASGASLVVDAGDSGAGGVGHDPRVVAAVDPDVTRDRLLTRRVRELDVRPVRGRRPLERRRHRVAVDQPPPVPAGPGEQHRRLLPRLLAEHGVHPPHRV